MRKMTENPENMTFQELLTALQAVKSDLEKAQETVNMLTNEVAKLSEHVQKKTNKKPIYADKKRQPEVTPDFLEYEGRMALSGFSSREIAQMFGFSETTVYYHLSKRLFDVNTELAEKVKVELSKRSFKKGRTNWYWLEREENYGR